MGPDSTIWPHAPSSLFSPRYCAQMSRKIYFSQIVRHKNNIYSIWWLNKLLMINYDPALTVNFMYCYIIPFSYRFCHRAWWRQVKRYKYMNGNSQRMRYIIKRCCRNGASMLRMIIRNLSKLNKEMEQKVPIRFLGIAELVLTNEC